MFHLKHFHVKQSVNPWYVTGFAEGCASFTYSRSGHVFVLYFGIKVSTKDVVILQAIQAFFGGIGRIYTIRRHLEQGVNEGSFAYFRVNRARELSALVSHFDRFPLAAAKAHQYKLWREMVRLKQQFRRPARDQLAVLASELTNLKRSTPSGP